jgi:predicted DNA-binding transcriptional regulator YafY
VFQSLKGFEPLRNINPFRDGNSEFCSSPLVTLPILDRREYLDCWCQETEGNTDLPKLQHNWSLRLDRITDASLSPIQTKWRTSLDQLTVELNLYNGLAFAYEPKPNDIYSDWSAEKPQVKRVLRDVSSTFWLFRELLPYGEDCLIVSPPELRERFIAKLKRLGELYQHSS